MAARTGNRTSDACFEARFEGSQHIAVTIQADTYEMAEKVAVDKMKTSLSTILERLRNY
jgi:hypothetical protein